jgi:UDP-glucose 4-epimerase
LTRQLRPARTLVTGGAGFIGGELIDSLLADGGEVTILDDLSTAEPDWFDRFRGAPGLRFIEGDAADPDAVDAAMTGHDRVVHLASGTDIAGGFDRPSVDFRNGILATEVVCEAMHRLAITELWYASSGVVYGRPARVPTAEGDGPLRPESHYAAAKLAGEAIVSGFAHLYGWRAFAFRFGNTVGRRSNHGVVHDLTVKLLRDPARLEVLGDGTPAKPYVAVTDLVAGMRHAALGVSTPGLTILNVGPDGTVSVRRVAELVIEAVGGHAGPPEIVFRPTGAAGGGGWPGDTALVEFDTGAMRALGWQPAMDAEDAIRDAAAGIAARYRESDRALLTSIERRATMVAGVGAG